MSTDYKTASVPPGHSPGRDELIARGLGLARRVARQYRGPLLSDEDLEGEAYLGLVEAAGKFDVATYPADSFGRYAERVIRTKIRQALERAPIVRMARALERAALKGRSERPRPYRVGVEDLGAMPPPDGDDAGDPRLELVREALGSCSDLSRRVLDLVEGESLSLSTAARQLGISRSRARAALLDGYLSVAAQFRRWGLDEPAWSRAIA